MIETLSANRADEALHIGRLPRRSECGQNFADVQAFGLRAEGGTIDAVAVSEQEARRLVPRKRMHEPCCGPFGSRMLGDIEMHDAPAIMSQDKKHVQDPEGNGGYHEEVHRDQLFNMIFQKGSPGL